MNLKSMMAVLLCVGAASLMGCGKSDSTTQAEPTGAEAPVAAKPAAPPAITASIAAANHPADKLVDLEATGDIDFVALVTSPAIEVFGFMQKKDVDDISVSGSSDKGITGFPCVNAKVGAITASTSAGYAGQYEIVGNENMTFDLKLSEASKVVQVFGYSKGAGCVAEVFDATGNSIAKTELAVGPDDEQTWLLKLVVDASGSADAKLVLTFAEAPAMTYSALAVGAVTISTTDTVSYADMP